MNSPHRALGDGNRTSDLQDIDAIRSALRLVDIDELALYEQPSRRKVAEIAVSLRRIKALVNPVIVDPERKLLIDGHHRVKAFQWLGLKRIPAFAVDYLSTSVEVRNWSWATSATAAEVRWAFELEGENQEDGLWSVMASDFTRSVIARRSFEAAAQSARYLAHLSLCFSAMGRSANLEPAVIPTKPDLIHSYVDPLVGKAEVLRAVARSERFPQEVNRHLVDGRPLSVYFPLDRLGSARDFERCVDEILRRTTPVSMRPGLRQGNRLYEEHVTLFTPRTEGS